MMMHVFCLYERANWKSVNTATDGRYLISGINQTNKKPGTLRDLFL